MAVDGKRLAVATHVNEVSILQLANNKWETLDVSGCFDPVIVYAVALDGDTLWLAGEQSLATYDLRAHRIKRCWPINSRWVRWLEIDKEYVWIVGRDLHYRGSLLERMAKLPPG